MRKILIAGASGVIGRALIEKLLENEELELIGLSREERDSHHLRLTWKKCDLFSLKDITEAMNGCEEAYYLVQFRPVEALNQGARQDYELIMADNFLRSAVQLKIKRIGLSSFLNDEVMGLFKRSSISSFIIEGLVPKVTQDAESIASHEKAVRSIQRFPLPHGKNAEWVASEYFRWLPIFFSTLIKVSVEDDLCTFYLVQPSLKILVLKKSKERSSPDRQLLYVVGGLLAGKMERGRLEFREIEGLPYVLAALHEFRPALPWYIYRFTQAIVHLIVMRAFGEHLKWYIISEKRYLT